MIKHNKGLVSVSFREKSPEEILVAMKKAKLSHIEWGSDIHAPCKDTERLKELVRLQDKYGIACCSYGTYFRLGKDDPCELKAYSDAAKILGTTILRIWCGDRNSDSYPESEKKAFLDTAKKTSEIAEKNGVTLCMECHNNTYTETLDGALELMKEVNSPHFQMYWQPNQFRSVDENMAYARAISPYIKNIHVFNWGGNNKYPLCEATDVWKRYLSCFDKSLSLLLEFMPDGRIESLDGEADALYKIIE